MSEKRFFTILADEEYTLIQEKGNLRNTYLKYSEVVDLLNRQQISIETMLENMEKLEKENEQLKQEVLVYKKAFQQQVQRCSL